MKTIKIDRKQAKKIGMKSAMIEEKCTGKIAVRTEWKSVHLPEKITDYKK